MSHYPFDLTRFRGKGRNSFVIFIWILVQMKTFNFAFEIN